MKNLFQIVRLFTGALFIFSGLVKLNDPSGFSIKLNEYFDVFAQDCSVKQDSVTLQIRVNNTAVYSQKYILYSFDSIRNLNVALNPNQDMSNPPTNTRWEVFGNFGGSKFEVPPTLNFPKKVSIQINSRSGAVFHKQYNYDSTQTGIKELDFSVNLVNQIQKESLWVQFFKSLKNYSLYFSIIFCALEVILGIAMILAYRMKLALIITALLVVFFTFLTWYSAYYNRVTDCGCFGDFLKLKPWNSFKKDLILLVLTATMFIGKKHYRPWPSESLSKKLTILSIISSVAFGIYCYRNLPVWDFLPYKIGNNVSQIIKFVPPGERATDSFSIKFVMQKGSDSVKVTTKEYADYISKGYTFVRQDRQLIIEGYKGPIHDFSIVDDQSGINYTDSFLNYQGYQWMFIAPFLNSDCHLDDLKYLNQLHQELLNHKVKLWGLSSAPTKFAQDTMSKMGFHKEVKFYSADQKMLMTMARYNPTVYLFNGTTVVGKWSVNDLPSIEEIKQLLTAKVQ